MPFQRTLAPLLALIACITAAPPAWRTQTYNANFDNLIAIPGVPLTPVGLYDNIYWDDISYASASLTGTQFHSQPNAAFVGSAESVDGPLTPAGVMQAGTMGSTAVYFDLVDFYFGCNLATVEQGVDVAVAATIMVQGAYYSNGKLSPAAFFTFLPFNATNPAMTHAILPAGFTGLKNVTLAVVVSNETPTLTACAFDNVEYTTHTYF